MTLPEMTAELDHRVEAGEGAAQDHDSIRQYFSEIGRVRLLTASQEVAIGRRIEEGRHAMLRALVAVPLARRAFREAGDGLRRGDVPVDDVIVLPEGGEPDVKTVRRVTRALTGLTAAKGKRAVAAIEVLPISPALIERIVVRVRAAGGRLDAVDRATAAVSAAKRELTEANLRLVVAVAKRYRWSGIPFGDLIQDGNLGLLRAVEKFQYRRGFKFSTYATWWIRQAITRGIAERGRTIRLPVHVVESLNEVMRSRALLTDRMGREPSTEELARHTRIPAPKLQLLLDAAPRPVSLELPVGDDATLADFLEDRSAVSPFESVAAAQRSAALARALDHLEPRAREIVMRRYGLGTHAPETLEEIGARLGLTRERIRQLEAQALAFLRRAAVDLTPSS
jgi:RNA polymerase sigma factor (sigma-70 family)